jgi:hypothetical protein
MTQKESILVNHKRLWYDIRFRMTETRGTPMQRNVISIASAVAIVIVIILTAVLVRHSKSTSSATASAQVLKPDPAKGWVEAVDYGKSVAFGVDQPLTGYVCDNTDSWNSGATIEFGVTHDGGQTWSALKTIPDDIGTTCEVIVSPYNANDVIIESYECIDSCKIHDYRSLDGGGSWKPLTLPNNENYINISFTWNSDTLYMLLWLSSISGSHQLAMSKKGSALVWMNEDGLPLISNYQPLRNITIWHGILYVGVDIDKLSPTYFATTDDGVHWSTAKVPCAGSLSVATDKKTLICRVNGTESTSRDDGKTWQQIQIDGQVQQNFFISGSTPDGTLYGLGRMIGAIYILSPGSTQWMKKLDLSSVQQKYYSLTVSSDAQGHPVALWYSEYIRQYSKPGIIYHAA